MFRTFWTLSGCESVWKWKKPKRKKFDVDSVTENHEELMKNKLILKSQQRFASEKHNLFTDR